MHLTDAQVPVSRATIRPIILFASAVHLVWATLVLTGSDAGRAAPLTELVTAIGRYPSAVLMYVAATLALYGIMRDGKHRSSWWPFVPQQALLVITSLSVIHVATSSAKPWDTIISGSVAALILSVFHTLAVSVLVAEQAGAAALVGEDRVADVYERMDELEAENASLHAELEHRLTMSGGSRPSRSSFSETYTSHEEREENGWPHPEQN